MNNHSTSSIFMRKVKHFHNYIIFSVGEFLFWLPTVYTTYKYPESPQRVCTRRTLFLS